MEETLATLSSRRKKQVRRLSFLDRFIKRAFDVVFSSCVLILGSPIYLIIAIAVAVSSPGPVFYRAGRVGRNGSIIGCWKFRTMFLNAEEILHEILDANPDLKKEWAVYRKLKNDPRITPIGKVLRKTSLDEIPQFWNVLIGDLSVVGPRPPTQEEVTKFYGKKAEKIFQVRPGITGLWQTSGRNQKTFVQRVRLEEHYVEQSCFFLDMWLVLKTVLVMIRPKGAF